MSLVLNSPPPTPIEPVTDVLHGVPVTDPYRWLEDQNSPRTRKWLEDQTAYTREYLDALPGRDRIRKRVEELLAVEVISEPWKVGNRYFYLKRSPYQEQPVIMLREGESGEEVVLVDPALRGEDSATVASIVNVSRDGKVLACGVRYGGTDSKSVEFVDVDSRRFRIDRMRDGFGHGLVFSEDNKGFYYSHELIDSSRPYYRAVYEHRFGTRPDEDRELFFAGENPNVHVGLFGSPAGKFLALFVVTCSDSRTFDLYLQDLTHAKPPQKILNGVDSVFTPFFVGDELLALTDWKAPNLRIVAIDPQHPERNHWRDVVRERPGRIKDFAVIDDFVSVGYVEKLCSRIDTFNLAGRRLRTIPCPTQGSAHLLRRPTQSDVLFYTFSSYDRPPTIYSYNPKNGEQKVWSKSCVPLDSSLIEVKKIGYKSKDGKEVPMFLVARKGQGLSTPLPTFLGAYGGFGSTRTPQFNAYSAFLAEHGFLFAFAIVRGGGELGGEWHQAGKRHNRQKAFDDFIAAAEWLNAHGYTVPDKLAIGGGSNAGLLVGAALTQRPDLFRVVICMGPLLDMLRYHRFNSAHLFVDEYGTPDREDDFLRLYAYSPYHHVEEGVPYPTVMFISGDEDTCCNPMHARKMAARLQAATSSKCPILLDYRPTWGHVPVQPLTQRIQALTDRLAFICHELGVSV